LPAQACVRCVSCVVCGEQLQSVAVGTHLMSSVTRTSSTASVLNLPPVAVKSLNSADGWPVCRSTPME
jgi:hypothetical protein